ncbi:Tetratricopeptide repeat superfamily protein [Perilla frutescens var. hirtella]|uniref:Tetratricopeptide repeat superfamily protein n=1 Tax=Perilla frutescens var. hirtella TaxID=608512 RepID=A0AAD4IXN6_PERFH|nr:Tetratricopeptide repeat superfamily protein [Perilla frutescens var. frutescens]KAH6787883.1 Tetratricopeptide repeat superfamily protein [Perilla frutescens var. hirtella]KAH6823291.1 Tetratricopeptide repeat superfamily protein [Perilla frutescens var. hirtella]
MASGSPAINKIERAHQMYREGKYAEALDYYTDALSMAKTTPQRIALHSNRAACYLKLHHFNKAAEECTSVLELDHNHTGALMLRAQTLVTLKEYHSALFDVNRLIELNPSSEVYRNLLARLKTQLSLAPIPEDEAEFDEDGEYVDEAEHEPYEEEQDSEKVEDLGRSVNNVTCDAAEESNEKSNFEDVRELHSPCQNMLFVCHGETALYTFSFDVNWKRATQPVKHGVRNFDPSLMACTLQNATCVPALNASSVVARGRGCYP